MNFPNELLKQPQIGIAPLLSELRAELLSATDGTDALYYRLAQLYLQIGKPLRALAMIEHLSGTYCPHPDLAPIEHIRETARAEFNDNIRPTTTLTMILKNEAHNIQRALDSIDTLVDEIVICDTGSTDTTVALVALYGVKVIHHPWSNDFSAARNAALEASSGDWILWMDGDDELESQSRTTLAELLCAPAESCALLNIVNQADSVGAFEFMQARLFPRRPDLRFQRRIHEQITPSAIAAGLSFEKHPEIRILHHGYDNPTTHQEKARRNIEMLIREIAVTDFDPSLWQSLGDSLMVVGQFHDAITIFELLTSVAHAYRVNPDVYVQAQYHRALCHKQLGDRRNTLRFLYQTLFLDPTRSEALFQLGVLYKESKDDDEACRWLLRCLKVAPPVRITATNINKIQMQAIHALTQILLEKKRFDEAHEVLDGAIKYFPTVVNFYTMMGQAKLGLGAVVDATRCFMKAISLAPASDSTPYSAIADIYKRLGDSQKYVEFKKLADSIPGMKL